MTDHKISDPADQAVTPGDPPHPGPWIKRNLLQPLGLKVAETSRRIGMNRPTLHNVLEGRNAVTSDLAYKLEALTGIDPDLLLSMQRAHDRARDSEQRERYAREIERVAAPAGA